MPQPINIPETVATFIESEQLFDKGTPLLLAVSGGKDSVAMLDILSKAGYKVAVAHCNFKLRGKDADDDEAFVKALAKKYDVAFHGTCFDTGKYAADHNLSIQMAARELRYQWFEQVRVENSYHAIAVAHHKNDTAETMLLNLSKGTGIAGLHGILPKSGKVVRPFLCLTSAEIETYVEDNKLSFREDVSNEKVEYQRNYIRHEVIPKLETLNPKLIEAIANTGDKLQHTEAIYQQGLKYYRKQLLEQRSLNYFISIKKLKGIEGYPTLLYELLKPYGFSEALYNEVLDILDSESGREVLSATHRVLKDREFLIVTPKDKIENSLVLIKDAKRNVKTSQFELKFHVKAGKSYHIKDQRNVTAINFDKLQFPLTLRPWKQGDYFYPLGMKKKKKLSRFFVDQKLSVVEKENVWVLCSGEHIVWVVGHRLDDRFKVTDGTKKVLEVKVRFKQ